MTKVILSFVILGCILSYATALDVCNGERNGARLKHPSDCAKYIVCMYGKPNGIMNCHKGLHFNRLTSECDTKESAACDIPVLKRSLSERDACENTTLTTTETPATTTVPCPENPPITPNPITPDTDAPETPPTESPVTPSPVTPDTTCPDQSSTPSSETSEPLSTETPTVPSTQTPTTPSTEIPSPETPPNPSTETPETETPVTATSTPSSPDTPVTSSTDTPAIPSTQTSPIPSPGISTHETPVPTDSPTPDTPTPPSPETPVPPSPETPTTTATSSTETPSTPNTVTPTPPRSCNNNLTICEGKADNTNEYINGTCSQYVVCISGCAIQFNCPNNLQYNLQTKQCDYPQNVNCPWTNLPPSGPSAGPSGIACEQSGKCVDQPDGTLLPDSNPNKYIVCQCQCEVKRPCPAGLVFNSNLKTCAFPDTSELA